MKKGPGDRLSGEVIEWLMRSFSTGEEWKQRARSVYLSSNGDSALARMRVSSLVRSYILDGALTPEDVDEWTENQERIVTKRVTPPKITTSNAAYVDWQFVADYLLLPCSSPNSDYEQETLRRQSEHQQIRTSYELRLYVYEARKLLEANPRLSESKVAAQVKVSYPKASVASVKEAKRLIADNVAMHPPVEPDPITELPLYASIYF